jgi:hypothetical protein
MSEATRLIVAGYVSLKDRVSLEDMRAHRQRLRKRLQDTPPSWVDTSKSIALFDSDLHEIEAGLERLDGSSAG